MWDNLYFKIDNLTQLKSRIEKYSDSNLILKVIENNNKQIKLLIKRDKGTQ